MLGNLESRFAAADLLDTESRGLIIQNSLSSHSVHGRFATLPCVCALGDSEQKRRTPRLPQDLCTQPHRSIVTHPGHRCLEGFGNEVEIHAEIAEVSNHEGQKVAAVALQSSMSRFGVRDLEPRIGIDGVGYRVWAYDE